MHYTLHITDRCNLRCKYCFENKKDNDLSFENIKSILDNAVKDESRRANITFYGGEPLLRKDIIYETVEYCKKLEEGNDFLFTYQINTNGILLDDEFIEFAKDNMFHICYSIDGTKECHDLNRVYRDGQVSFDLVNENAVNLLSKYPYVTAMMVTTVNNIQHFYDSVKYLFDVGFKYIFCGIDYTSNWDDESIEKLRKEYEKVGRLYIEKTLNEDSFYLSPIEHKIDTHISKDKICELNCQLGLKHIDIGTDGNIYPCIQFVGMQKFIMGNCKTGIVKEKQLELMKKSAKEHEICKECELKNRCKHTCGCMNLMTNKDPNKLSPITCEIERIIIETSDKIASTLYKKRANMFIQKKYNKIFPIVEIIERSKRNGIKSGEKV